MVGGPRVLVPFLSILLCSDLAGFRARSITDLVHGCPLRLRDKENNETWSSSETTISTTYLIVTVGRCTGHPEFFSENYRQITQAPAFLQPQSV